MKVANRILLSVLTCFIFSLAGFSQTPPNLENGFKPFGSYDGTKFDTVNVMNGNLMVHIPLTPEYPERGGKLDLKFLLYLTSKNWIGGCTPSPCRWTMLSSGTAFQRSWEVSVQGSYNIDATSGQILYSSVFNKLVTGDGASHIMYPIPGSTDASGQVTKFETSDRTGYHIELSGADPVTGLLDSVVVTGRDGTQYLGTMGGGSCSGPTIVALLRSRGLLGYRG